MTTITELEKDLAAKLTCQQCGELFSSRNALFRHLKVDHNTNKRQKADDGNDHEPAKVDLRIQLVQEDDWYRIIVKPQGLATMGSSGEETVMNSDQMLLENALEHKLRYKKAVPCHRLDRATGGLMVCSKSKLAESRLKTSFRDHQVHKRYRAIVFGKLEPLEGTIDLPLSDVPSVTRYKVLQCTPSEQYKYLSTVDLWPVTGRKHQLRKHMQMVGHSIIGDPRYSSALTWPEAPFQYLFLWAVEIDFPHPSHLQSSRKSGDCGGDSDGETIELDDADASAGAIVDNDDIDSATPEIATATSLEAVEAITMHPERVSVSIDEPSYYEEFRRHHIQAWQRAQMQET